jgi:hypothetical protein
MSTRSSRTPPNSSADILGPVYKVMQEAIESQRQRHSAESSAGRGCADFADLGLEQCHTGLSPEDATGDSGMVWMYG